jgi:hypothetical protein
MVLVEILEFVLGQVIEGNASRGDLGENLVLVDRMGVIELDHPCFVGITHGVAP